MAIYQKIRDEKLQYDTSHKNLKDGYVTLKNQKKNKKH